MINCVGVGVGVPSIACISAQTDYVIGYVLMVLIGLVVFFRLSAEPIKRRVAATMLVLMLFIALGTVQNMLFPQQYIVGAIVLFIGASFLLLQKNGG